MELNKTLSDSSWKTEDEKKAIKFLSGEIDSKGRTLTNEERISKLTTWIETSYNREWSSKIDVVGLRKYASGIKRRLKDR